MTEVYRFSESEMLFFFLVLMRTSAFVVSWPVFGVENISAQLKILFAVILALVLFPTLRWTPAQYEAVKTDVMTLAMREAFVGLSLGYLARLFFFAFRVAGEMMSQATGLGSASMFNPAVGAQVTPIENFYILLATLFYLGANGHHLLITGLARTFEWAPCARMTLNYSQFAGVGQMAQEVIELGLRFAAPVVISILVVNLVLGVVGKTVPQLNVLVTSFPINIMAGLALMIVTMPLLMDQMAEFLRLSVTEVFQFVKVF
jgi:flagellar biosynthetic protein FliR